MYVYVVEEKREECGFIGHYDPYWIIISVTSSKKKAEELVQSGEKENKLRTIFKVKLNEIIEV